MTLALGHADGALAARSGVESVVVPLEHPAVPTRLLVDHRTTRWRILSLSRRWIWVSFLILLGIGGGFGGLFSI